MEKMQKLNEASIKGQNRKTGESFGMVIGSDKKNREGNFELTIRVMYSSRISAYKLTFNSNNELIAIKDYGYSMDGKFPDMKGGGSVKSIRPNGRETIIQIAKITSPAFAKKIVQHVKKVNESVNEGQKRYNQKDGVGKSKYVISYHDGKKKHKDGSDFFDMQIFRNKKDLAKFVNALHKGGYKYGFGESVNEDDMIYDPKTKSFKIKSGEQYVAYATKGNKVVDTVRDATYNDRLFSKFKKDMERKGLDVYIDLVKNRKVVRQVYRTNESLNEILVIVDKFDKNKQSYGKIYYKDGGNRIGDGDLKKANKELEKLSKKHKGLTLVSVGRNSKMYDVMNEAYVVAYGKGPKPMKPSFAAYADKKLAQKFMADMKKDGYKVMMTQKKIRGVDESVNEAKVETERFFGKKGIIIMIRDGNKMVSAIFKDKKNADKFNRNNPSDVKKLLQLAKKTKFPKAIDEKTYGISDDNPVQFEAKYNYKADALTAYFKGKIDAKELDSIARNQFKSGIATKKELSNFLSNKFTQDVMSDTYGIPAGTLVKRVRGLMKFAEGMNEDKKQVKDLVKKVKFEKIFYDVLSTMEKKFGKRKYRMWLEKSLKDFGENPKHYDYRTNAAIEEKLFQLGKK